MEPAIPRPSQTEAEKLKAASLESSAALEPAMAEFREFCKLKFGTGPAPSEAAAFHVGFKQGFFAARGVVFPSRCEDKCEQKKKATD